MRDFVPTSPLTTPLYTAHIRRVQLLTNFFISQPEDGHCQVSKHVVILYVINSIHISTIKYSCFRQVHTLQYKESRNEYFAHSVTIS